MAEVLTRESAIPNFTTPTGRKLGVRQFEPNPSLYEVVFVDKKPGEIPAVFQNHRFTKRKYAEAALLSYLNEFWDTSDNNKRK